jgi:hypothetical protein
MDLFAVADQVIELLRSRGRVSYRALQVQFNLARPSLPRWSSRSWPTPTGCRCLSKS